MSKELGMLAVRMAIFYSLWWNLHTRDVNLQYLVLQRLNSNYQLLLLIYKEEDRQLQVRPTLVRRLALTKTRPSRSCFSLTKAKPIVRLLPHRNSLCTLSNSRCYARLDTRCSIMLNEIGLSRLVYSLIKLGN